MDEYRNNEAYELDWEDEISNDGGGNYILLEEGDYNFTVTNFERGRFPGGQKIPECKKVMLTLSVETPEGTANVKHDLILWSTIRFRICDFCISIGQGRRDDETIRPNWSDMVGRKGRARFKTRRYTTKSGEEREVNEVDKFYDYDPAFFASAPKATHAQQSGQKWEAGKF